MKAKLILENGREIEMELTEEQTEHIRKETKWPREGDAYCFVDTYGSPTTTSHTDHFIDDGRINLGNTFRTEQEAANMVRALRLIEAVRQDRLELNGDWVPNWNSSIEDKYSLYFYHPEQGLYIGTNLHDHGADIFGSYKSEEITQQIIKNHHDELLWYFTKFLPERG